MKFRIHSRHRADRLGLRLCALALALLPVTAHAIADCTVSATGVAFGSYSFTNPAPTDAASNVVVSCSLLGLFSLLVTYDILLSPGGSGSYAPRKMTSGANQLQYNLYTNAGRSIVWGDGTAGTSIVSDGYPLGTGTTVRNYPVYGRLPAGQNTPAGAYTDIITVTVNY
ncbi:MAG: SCPU domain-containing protein [Hydrogenophilales bacterium CG_4_9_14_3_um_filter_59_35]|nr:MAG: pilus assembly protein [Hydrogenophilales bacterium CG18_big_fil_WC_8_21_14_2_50_58_12]PIX98565.1 MAG: SCPU domain-containing protein [Hydrogenophilales bacterium CG_4_10_14_3_um_filter_58_23]PJB08194.1 MAG: SCPU domain-containing protein [Hydrogenophilales bacterium CG_4_9_14_3_um_filter_59_35]